PGVFHGSLSYVLQNADGQVQPAHSVSAGLDYPGVGPEHAYLKDSGRVLYEAVSDRDALDAFAALSRLEGILPALESAHAVAWVREHRERWRAGELMQLVSKGMRATQLYLPNNPVYQRAVENIRGAFRQVWTATDEIDFDVRE